MDSKNVFEETVKTLTQDAMSLQQKFHKLQESNDIRASIDCLRLLKDTLSLIKEYDWHLEYSEYKTDGQKQIAVWEQNHCGEIRNHKFFDIVNHSDKYENKWYFLFGEAISSGQSLILQDGYLHRNTGKSYALAKLCNKYNGIVVYKRNGATVSIENKDKELNIVNTFVCYERVRLNLKQYEDKIIFIDEGSGLSDEEIDELKKKHIVVGFSS